MNIVCLDMEGVLVPEIWIAFAEASGIPELRRTTRDEPDYDKLMTWRLNVLKEHGLGLKEIQETIVWYSPTPSKNLPSPSWKSSAGQPSSAILWKSLKTAKSPVTKCAVKSPNTLPLKHCNPWATIPLPVATASTTLA